MAKRADWTVLAKIISRDGAKFAKFGMKFVYFASLRLCERYYL